jgi:excisionase family DNA binding protein
MTKHSNECRLLTVEQAAERLGVKTATVRSWILKRQKLEVVKIGRLVRITDKSIEKFIEANTIPPREDKEQ